MSFLVWNCHGLANPRAVRFLKEIISQLRPCLIFLSETLVKNNVVVKVCKEIQYAGCFAVDAQGLSGGLALLWKNENGVEIKGSCNHYIDFEVQCEQIGRWRYTGFYGCPEGSRRRESWNLLRNLASQSQLPWSILGDFNDLMYAHEKRGRRGHSNAMLEGFRETVNDCQLNDLGFTGNEFTWERFRGSEAWVQERLDRGLANSQWQHLFPNAEVKVLEVSTSDHLPLFLELNRMMYVQKARRFRFENVWIKEEQCSKLVQDSWLQVEGRSLINKMEYVCLKLDEWGGGIVQEMKTKIQFYRQQMRKFRSRRDGYGVKKYNDARWEFLKLLEKKEVYWKQRAKQFWLREGDKNSRFFHKYASGRKRHNQLKRLKDREGNWHESKEEIKHIITEYFSDLFKSSQPTEKLTERERVETVTEEQNQELLLPVTSKEVKCAVFSMHPDKSPGHDGLNPGFFQAYWHIVGADIVKFCQQFFQTGELPEGINRTLVCLIPKVKQPKQMGDLRPISLCNVLFRILSKVMANRLKICLPTLISEQQSAFVEGRLLTDNALVAFEINHFIRRKTQGHKGVAGFKIDVSKAYDRLEWGFLESMMEKFGFSEIWRDRVMRCVKSVSYSFTQDGEVFGEVNPQRGIRQGDPISPYLYILCAEGLSSIMRRYEDVGLIHGCSIARGAPAISHLLFADDCYFFFKATGGEATSMKNILTRYEAMSGQAINLQKSAVVFSPNTRDDDRVQVCNILQVREESTPGKYLGLPMFIGRNKSRVFKFLTERVNNKLQGWNNKSISRGGKMVLLKTAAQSIPTFWMNLFQIPNEVCQGIQKIMNAFWWGSGGGGKGIRWLAWERMCAAKEGGGLGFRDLSKFNLAMLAKQGWRLVNNENPLVTRIMKAKYFPRSDFLNASMGANPSYMWRSLMAAQKVIQEGCRKRIGNGESTAVWEVPWLPCQENGYMSTYMPNELEGTRVVNFMDENKTGWDEEVLHDVCNERDTELIKRIPIPVSGREDSWFWLFEDKGCFSVKSCYRRLQGEQVWTNAEFWRKLWSLELPGKVINFVWRLCRDCLPTTVNLATKRVQIELKCPWCLVRNEDDTHVLFDCSFARGVWANIEVPEINQIGVQTNAKEILRQLFQLCTKEKLALITTVCWSLWNRRNRWVWDKVSVTEFGVKATAMTLLAEWRKCQEEKIRGVTGTGPSAKRWNPPPQGWMKVNTDASVFGESRSIGVGGVIRDASGEFIRARARKVMANLQPREAEALSLKEALSWVKDLGYKRCIFETDAKVLAEACRGTNGKAYFHTIVLDCIEFFKHFEDVQVEFVHRSANAVAHTLARATHSMSGTQEWCIAPSFISDVLLIDSI